MTDTSTAQTFRSGQQMLFDDTLARGIEYRQDTWNDGHGNELAFYAAVRDCIDRNFIPAPWPVAAQALNIYNEAFTIQRDMDHGTALGMALDLALSIPEPSPENVHATVDDLEAALTSGAVPDAKLAKLRVLLERLRQAEAPITDGSDPRLLPVLAVAAQEANERDYCEVYDNISRVAGFPSRDELRDLGALTLPTWLVTAEVEVEYTVTRTHLITYVVEAGNEESAYDQARSEYNSESDGETLDRTDEDGEAPDNYSERVLSSTSVNWIDANEE